MKLEELEKETKGKVLYFPKPEPDTKPTTVSLLVPVKQLGAYVMKLINPQTGEIVKTYEIYKPDSHLGAVGED